MVQTAERGVSKSKTAPHEKYLEAFRIMLQTRIFEEKLASLYRGGLITGGVYLGKGQEAVSVACGLFLQKGDVFAPLIRDQAGRSAFGEPLVDVARTYLGSRSGPMRGRDGNIHRGCPSTGQLAMISHLGAMVSVVSGMLYKILPFLSWLHLQNAAAGRSKVPHMGDYLAERFMKLQFRAHLVALALFLLAIFWPVLLARSAGLALVVAHGLLLANLLRILRRFRSVRQGLPAPA